eukprot:Gb_14575 [translate_table: standard]
MWHPCGRGSFMSERRAWRRGADLLLCISHGVWGDLTVVVDRGATVGADLEPLESCFVFSLGAIFGVGYGVLEQLLERCIIPGASLTLCIFFPCSLVTLVPPFEPSLGALRVVDGLTTYATPAFPSRDRWGALRPPSIHLRPAQAYTGLAASLGPLVALWLPCVVATASPNACRPRPTAAFRPCNKTKQTPRSCGRLENRSGGATI